MANPPRSPLKRLESRFDLARYLAPSHPRNCGDNVSVECPQCGKPDKLWILTKPKGTKVAGSFICYYCHDTAGGGSGVGPLQLIQWMEDCDFTKAIQVLAAGANTDRAEDFVGAVNAALAPLHSATEDDGPLATIDLPEFFVPIDSKHRPKYLRERGITVDEATKHNLGYCSRGFYYNRLVVPVYMDGHLVSFQARWMKKVPPEGTKKTRFPLGVKTGAMLFNYDHAKKARRIVITEDPFSAIRVGWRAVATFGTSLSRRQLELLLQTDATSITVMWDRDALDKAWALVKPLSEFWRVGVAELPDARDPDEHTVPFLRELELAAKPLDPVAAFAGLVKRHLRGLPGGR